MVKILSTYYILFLSIPLLLFAQATNEDNNTAFRLTLDSNPNYAIYNSQTAYRLNSMDALAPSLATSDRRYEKLIKEFAYLQVFAIATIGTIAILPENVSQWSTEDKQFTDAKTLLQKHADNVSRGAVWDHDDWSVNYIGHPIAGSYFYVWGRQAGLNWQESAMLTTLMSTFFWEYGWESFAEAPSIQDLIITPLLGSILGESTNYLYNTIVENDGKIYNSIWLGYLGKGLLNPIGELNAYFDDVFEAADIQINVDYSYTKNKTNYQLGNTFENHGLIQSYFKFNFTLKY